MIGDIVTDNDIADRGVGIHRITERTLIFDLHPTLEDNLKQHRELYNVNVTYG
jgi:hypothetical protein